MATARGITETKLYDHEAVIERYGIPPELIPDFYGLKGDTSDNIPGVPGIGDKTAAQLLQQFGSLEECSRTSTRSPAPSARRTCVDHADDARVSKRLATVQRDVAVDFDPPTEAAREPDRSRLREVFREFELRDPLRRLEEAFGAEAARAAPRRRRSALRRACARARRRTPRALGDARRRRSRSPCAPRRPARASCSRARSAGASAPRAAGRSSRASSTIPPSWSPRSASGP